MGANVDVKSLSKDDKDELVCTYAALLLHDSKLEITGEKLNKVIKASGNTVEPYWPGLFAKALEGQDIASLLSNVGSAGPAAGGAPAAGGGAAEADAPKKEEKGGRARGGCRHGRSLRGRGLLSVARHKWVFNVHSVSLRESDQESDRVHGVQRAESK